MSDDNFAVLPHVYSALPLTKAVNVQKIVQIIKKVFLFIYLLK